MQSAHEKKRTLRNPIAGFSPSQQVRFFITFKLNPRRVRAALTRHGPWPGGDHVRRGDRQKSPGLCNREHIAQKPLSMDYDGSDCTCIHSPSSVSLIHLFFFSSSFLGPLTLSYKPAHTLTYSQLLSSMRSSFLCRFLSFSHYLLLRWIALNSYSTITATLIYEYLLVIHNSLLYVEVFPSLWHVLPQHPAVCIWVHCHTFRAEGLLICAIDFLIGSAPRLVNENMLCAGNQTWSFLWNVCMSLCLGEKVSFGCSYNVLRCWKCSPVSVSESKLSIFEWPNYDN